MTLTLREDESFDVGIDSLHYFSDFFPLLRKNWRTIKLHFSLTPVCPDPHGH
ncbi:hypothetical protein [Paludibacterium denitrificans]|uniref:Uncharacterized protein n=1 Tax=Paludibacterium denitrificans TaxID=2675226 RepID=A0A844GFR7_9NEIS|nr:hypothetical protein [Paludibacterium denitrificans]MTD34160.1 hypothetical protein [Paludibacterium denitrificans]